MQPVSSWTSPKTQRGLPSKTHHLGFFAKEHIKKGEVLAIKGGHIIDRKTLLDNLKVIQSSQLQITDDLYIAPLNSEETQQSMVYCNHSCEPNGGYQGQVVFMAMRDIAAGEEILSDYAMYLDDDIMRFDCNCQTVSCRKLITGRDWQRPELQAKYKGYFVWFLEQKIRQQTAKD
ncbi:MAG: SET domain-containing protein [Candidatus Saccharimonadales bacterium]